MMQIPLQNIPNQSLSLQLDGNLYDLNFHSVSDGPDGNSGITGVDIAINNIVIVTGVRAVAGFPLIASYYQENGNFIFYTVNEEYPDWRQFGITQFLLYVSEAELIEIYGNA